ncbi:unnamed protein product, partial [Meganyctiphanes norvegica]
EYSKSATDLLILAVNAKDILNEDIYIRTLDLVLMLSSHDRFNNHNILKSEQKLKSDKFRSSDRDSPDSFSTLAFRTLGFITPPRYESFPKSYVKKTNGNLMRDFLGKHSNNKDEDGCRTESYGDEVTGSKDEWKVSYWREDRDLNEFHNMWHEYNTYISKTEPICGNPEYKHGEMFYYFHNQLLSRYDMERLSNDLPRVQTIYDGWPIILEGYNAKKIKEFLTRCPLQFMP